MADSPDFTWPRFAEPVVIDATRSWTATFDSYDQRNDNTYYIVTLMEAGREPRRFMARWTSAGQALTGRRRLSLPI